MTSGYPSIRRTLLLHLGGDRAIADAGAVADRDVYLRHPISGSGCYWLWPDFDWSLWTATATTWTSMASTMENGSVRPERLSPTVKILDDDWNCCWTGR